MSYVKYQTAKVRLRYTTDPNEPELIGKIMQGLGRVVVKIRVTSKHPVWAGAELRQQHFAVLDVAQ